MNDIDRHHHRLIDPPLTRQIRAYSSPKMEIEVQSTPPLSPETDPTLAANHDIIDHSSSSSSDPSSSIDPSSIDHPTGPIIESDGIDEGLLSHHLSELDIRYFPALHRSSRYMLIRNLQSSLFGSVKLARDMQSLKKVAIKISMRKLAQTGRSKNGSRVLENVKREVHVMKFIKGVVQNYLHEADMRPPQASNTPLLMAVPPSIPIASSSFPSSSSSSSSASSSSFSSSLIQQENKKRKNNPSLQFAVTPSPSDLNDNSPTINSNSNTGSPTLKSEEGDTGSMELMEISRSDLVPVSRPFYENSMESDYPLPPGADNICMIIEELEDEHFHYLITEYIDGSDLHSLLVSIPDHRLREDQAKFLFRQLIMAVYFLHSHNVAHLDLSLENVCVDRESGKIKLIDFGVAAIHPRAEQKSSSTSPPSANTTPSTSLPTRSTDYNQLLPDNDNNKQLIVGSNTSLGFINGLGMNGNHRIAPRWPSPLSDVPLMSFVCAAIPDKHRQPGKIGYQSPELHNGMPFDAFANDLFSCGVILYSLVTGRPPWVYPHPSDPWFKLIASGQWLQLIQHVKNNAAQYYREAADEEKPSNDINGSGGTGGGFRSSDFLANRQRALEYLRMYDGLSSSLLQLLDSLLKPQAQRMRIEQVINHPWLVHPAPPLQRLHLTTTKMVTV